MKKILSLAVIAILSFGGVVEVYAKGGGGSRSGGSSFSSSRSSSNSSGVGTAVAVGAVPVVNKEYAMTEIIGFGTTT